VFAAKSAFVTSNKLVIFRLSDHWRYKVDFILSPGASVDDATTGDSAVGVDDAYLEYAGDFFSVVIGENNVTSPLEDRTSSLDIPFIERSSIINTYGYGRAAGVAGLVTGANWMAAVGVYGDSLNNSDTSFVTSTLGWGVTFARDASGKATGITVSLDGGPQLQGSRVP
jgi:phosphate-selective porin